MISKPSSLLQVSFTLLTFQALWSLSLGEQENKWGNNNKWGNKGPGNVLRGRTNTKNGEAATRRAASTTTSSSSSSLPSFNNNFFLGTQAIVAPGWEAYRIAPFSDHEYSEPGYDMLTEFRESVAATGINHFKFKLAPNNCESYQLNCTSSDLSSLTQLSQVTEIKATLADPRFQWYHIWGYSFTLPKKLLEPFTDEQLEAEYNEVYEWTTYMLETYRDTGKVFFLGNWEGDWELMGSSGCKSGSAYDFSCAPSQEVINKYIQWTSTRQRAIDAAKQDIGTQGVNVFFYIEFTLAEENFQDDPTNPGVPRPTMLNSVVPHVNPDFLSYSSYKSTNSYMNHQSENFNLAKVDESFWSVLDYAESRLASKDTDFSMALGDMTRRVFIGEFSPVNTRDPELFAPSAAQVVRAALEWGCPFVLHWEVYDNYSSAVPLLPVGTADIYTFTPLRQLFKDWNDAATAYVEQNGPSPEEMRLWAVEWFQSRS